MSADSEAPPQDGLDLEVMEGCVCGCGWWGVLSRTSKLCSGYITLPHLYARARTRFSITAAGADDDGGGRRRR